MLRVNGYFHQPDHAYRARTPFARTIPEILRDVPRDAWILTNYQLPMIPVWRPTPGPAAALYATPTDGELMNGHIIGIYTFDLPPRRPAAETFIPEPWRTGPALLITPDLQPTLDGPQLRHLVKRPVYFLVVRPAYFPVVADYYAENIEPWLRATFVLKPIQSRGDVTFYQVEGLR